MLTAYMTVLIPQSCWNSWSKQPNTKARLTGCVFTIKIKHCIISEKDNTCCGNWQFDIISLRIQWSSCLTGNYISIYKNIDKEERFWFGINLITNFIMFNSFKIQFKTRGGRPRHKLEFVISVFSVTVFYCILCYYILLYSHSLYLFCSLVSSTDLSISDISASTLSSPRIFFRAFVASSTRPWPTSHLGLSGKKRNPKNWITLGTPAIPNIYL